jgi:hypothetical protein
MRNRVDELSRWEIAVFGHVVVDHRRCRVDDAVRAEDVYFRMPQEDPALLCGLEGHFDSRLGVTELAQVPASREIDVVVAISFSSACRNSGSESPVSNMLPTPNQPTLTVFRDGSCSECSYGLRSG